MKRIYRAEVYRLQGFGRPGSGYQPIRRPGESDDLKPPPRKP